MYLYIHLLTKFDMKAIEPHYKNYYKPDCWLFLMKEGIGVCQNYNSFISFVENLLYFPFYLPLL